MPLFPGARAKVVAARPPDPPTSSGCWCLGSADGGAGGLRFPAVSGQGTSDSVGLDSEARRAAERLSRVQPLWSLEEKVAPAHAALVVIDVQNDFCAPEGMMSAEGLDVGSAVAAAERLEDFIAAARRAGVLVIFVRSFLSSDDNRYLSDVLLEQATRRRAGSYTLRPVCVEDTFGGDFYGNVRPAAGDPVVTKHRYSAFLRTGLETVLRTAGIRTVLLAGVATNVCVESTARDAFMRDFYVVLASDGTAAYSASEHESTLATIDRYFGQVASIAEVTTAWNS